MNNDNALSIPELKEIVEKTEDLNKIIIFPGIPDLNNMNILVRKFIAEKKRIVYGGTAITVLLDEGISENKFLDYDFYSSEYIRDSITIANELFNAGYKFVRRINAIHPDTVRVGAEFGKEFLADITYMPTKIYNKLPTVVVDGIYYADPQWLKLDLYRSVINPHLNMFRWKKSYIRLLAIEKKYPLICDATFEYKIKENKQLDELIIKYLIETVGANGLIASGMLGYKLYKSILDESVEIDHYTFFAIDGLIEARKLSNYLKNKTKDKIKIKKYYPYLDILTKHFEIWINNHAIISIYEIGDFCFGIKQINMINVMNYHGLLWFLNAIYCVKGLLSDNQFFMNLICFINNDLKKLSMKYHKVYGINEFSDDSPFQIFQVPCLTENVEYILNKSYIKMYKGESTGYPGYKPNKNNMQDPNDVSDMIYQNNFLGEEIVGEEITFYDSIKSSSARQSKMQ